MIALAPVRSAPHRVLIIKPSALGDVVTALPVLRGLRRTFPAAHVAWLIGTRYADLLAGDADLDEVIGFDRVLLGRAWRSPRAAAALAGLLTRLHRGGFDWVIDMQGLLRSGLLAVATGAPIRAGFEDAREGAAAFYTVRGAGGDVHTVDRNIALARRLGVDARPEDMTLAPSAPGRAFAARLLGRHALPPKGFLACVPPTRWPSKRYPPGRWRAVIRALAGRLPVALLGAPGDRDLCGGIAEGLGAGVVNLAGRTSIPEVVAVIAASAAVVCCDSAAKFIAPAVGVPAVVIMGPTRVARTGPYLLGRAVVAEVPCQGCLRRRCRHTTCMVSIRPDEVISSVQSVLAEQEQRCP